MKQSGTPLPFPYFAQCSGRFESIWLAVPQGIYSEKTGLFFRIADIFLRDWGVSGYM
jgi:hypothetical protein